MIEKPSWIADPRISGKFVDILTLEEAPAFL